MPDSANLTNRYSASVFLVLLLAAAVYQKAMWYLPTGDDLRILSSVSQTRNPLSYFATDWGMQNTYLLDNGQRDTARRTYRPLHSISIWLGYRAFGVWASPNQFINLLLHVVNVLLLLRILRRLGLDTFTAFLLATLGLISLYTASPATWVSDRQTLIVGMAALLLIGHIVGSDGELRSNLNPWLIGCLTVIAVLFKESGLIIPLVAGVFIAFAPYKGPRRAHLVVCILLVASYAALRLFLFGTNSFSYASDGFVFGNRHYSILRDLPWKIGLWARFETVAKNFSCVFLPIFDPLGRIDSVRELITNILWWLPTAALSVIATRRPIARVQWLALAVIAINSAVHVQVFRYRVEYVSQMAFCLYVASSPIWREGQAKVASIARRKLAVACCGLLAFVTVSQVNRYVQAGWSERRDEVINQRLTTVVAKYPISASIVEQVLARYAPTLQASQAKMQ
jgi:hypothetical protein